MKRWLLVLLSVPLLLAAGAEVYRLGAHWLFAWGWSPSAAGSQEEFTTARQEAARLEDRVAALQQAVLASPDEDGTAVAALNRRAQVLRATAAFFQSFPQIDSDALRRLLKENHTEAYLQWRRKVEADREELTALKQKIEGLVRDYESMPGPDQQAQLVECLGKYNEHRHCQNYEQTYFAERKCQIGRIDLERELTAVQDPNLGELVLAAAVKGSPKKVRDQLRAEMDRTKLQWKKAAAYLADYETLFSLSARGKECRAWAVRQMEVCRQREQLLDIVQKAEPSSVEALRQLGKFIAGLEQRPEPLAGATKELAPLRRLAQQAAQAYCNDYLSPELPLDSTVELFVFVKDRNKWDWLPVQDQEGEGARRVHVFFEGGGKTYLAQDRGCLFGGKVKEVYHEGYGSCYPKLTNEDPGDKQFFRPTARNLAAYTYNSLRKQKQWYAESVQTLFEECRKKELARYFKEEWAQLETLHGVVRDYPQLFAPRAGSPLQ